MLTRKVKSLLDIPYTRWPNLSEAVRKSSRIVEAMVARYEDIKSAWWWSFAAGTLCSLIEAVVDPDGWA
jgi:hypothetical protein